MTEDFVITSAGVDVAGRKTSRPGVADFQLKIAELKMETIETFVNADGPRARRASASPAETTGCSGCSAGDGKTAAFSVVTSSWLSC